MRTHSAVEAQQDLIDSANRCHHAHAYPDDTIRRNLDAVRTGAMVHDAGSDAELRRLGLIRVNSAGWYDLTPLGRAVLAGDNERTG